MSYLLGLLVCVPLVYGLFYGNGRGLGAAFTGTRLVRLKNGQRIGTSACWTMLMRTLLFPLMVVLFLALMVAATAGGTGSAGGGGETVPGNPRRIRIDDEATRRLRSTSVGAGATSRGCATSKSSTSSHAGSPFTRAQRQEGRETTYPTSPPLEATPLSGQIIRFTIDAKQIPESCRAADVHTMHDRGGTESNSSSRRNPKRTQIQPALLIGFPGPRRTDGCSPHPAPPRSARGRSGRYDDPHPSVKQPPGRACRCYGRGERRAHTRLCHF